MYYAITDALIGVTVVAVVVITIAGIIAAGVFVLRAMHGELKRL